MAKQKMIGVRVDDALKRRIEKAAESQGVTITTFLIRAAETAVKAAEKKQASARNREPGRTAARKTSGACPTFFKALCLEASRGGDQGYDWTGRKLVRSAASLVVWDTPDELRAKFAELKRLIRGRDNEGVLGWFDRELPRCMALIPRRRRPSFLTGVYEEVEEDDSVLIP